MGQYSTLCATDSKGRLQGGGPNLVGVVVGAGPNLDRVLIRKFSVSEVETEPCSRGINILRVV
jgi:hypothetical protein